MKSKPLLFLFALTAMTVMARAQFTASTAVTADSNVDAAGTAVSATSVRLVFDTNFGEPGGTSDTVNGVTFTGPPPSDGYTLTGFFNDADSSGVAGQSGMSAGFDEVLSFSLLNSTSGTATIFGLTSGKTYQAQIFAGATNLSGSESISNGTDSGTLNFGTSVTPSGDEYVTDTFTAGLSGSETFSFTALTGGNVAINAFDIREVPEPSTYAMLFGGLGLLVLVARLRCKLTA